jgi:hypothetical protein
MSALSRIQNLPEEQRTAVALLAAIVVTVLIGMGWFMLSFEPVNQAPKEPISSSSEAGTIEAKPLY